MALSISKRAALLATGVLVVFVVFVVVFVGPARSNTSTSTRTSRPSIDASTTSTGASASSDAVSDGSPLKGERILRCPPCPDCPSEPQEQQEKQQDKPPQEKANDAGRPRLTTFKPPHVLSNFFRLAKYRCQDKEAMIRYYKDVVIVEVGANEGEETKGLLAMGNVKTIYAYEPTPSKISKIKSVTSGNAKKMQLKNAAVSDFSGRAKLYIPYGDGGSQQDSLGSQKSWSPGHNERGVEVDVVKLDDEIHEHVHMLKSDTQGSEFHVLRGAEHLIDKYGIDIIHLEYSPKLAEYNGEDLGEMLEWLWDRGYSCFDCEEFGPPPLESDRSFKEYPKTFAGYHHEEGEHGQWTDIVCLKMF